MIVQATTKDGMPAVAWEEKHTRSPQHGKTLKCIFIGLVVGLFVLGASYVAIDQMFRHKHGEYAFLFGAIAAGYFFWEAILEYKKQSGEMVRGANPDTKGEYGYYLVERVSCAAYLVKDKTGNLFLDVMKDGYSHASIPLGDIRAFALQSIDEYEGPRNRCWPHAFVIVADTGHGSSVQIADHAGMRNELGQLLAKLTTTFIEGRPAAAPRRTASPMQTPVTATFGTQQTAGTRRNDLI